MLIQSKWSDMQASLVGFFFWRKTLIYRKYTYVQYGLLFEMFDTSAYLTFRDVTRLRVFSTSTRPH